MKVKLEIWILKEAKEGLKKKAQEAGFEGKGATSHYIEKVGLNPIAFLDNNLLATIKCLNLIE